MIPTTPKAEAMMRNVATDVLEAAAAHAPTTITTALDQNNAVATAHHGECRKMGGSCGPGAIPLL